MLTNMSGYLLFVAVSMFVNMTETKDIRLAVDAKCNYGVFSLVLLTP